MDVICLNLNLRNDMNKFMILILIFSILIFTGCVDTKENKMNQYQDNITNVNMTNVVITNATEEGIIKANNMFALELYSELKEKEQGNIFFSPYSISTALGMVYEGARGETAKEIQSVFHFSDNDVARRSSILEIYNRLNKKDAKYKLDIANALWTQKDYPILDSYIETVSKYYGGRATNVDFIHSTEETRQIINSWVENKTNNKIKDLFPQGSLDPTSRLVITNAIYFKGNWTNQFIKSLTKDDDFNLSNNKSVKVPMMKDEEKYGYNETEDLQILEMPYEGKNLSMLVILPKRNDFGLIDKSLTIENLNQWRKDLINQEVTVYMPKFTFNTKYTLNGDLIKMGMYQAFNPDLANFSGIDGTKNLFIQIVIHQTFVNVDEGGTEAAAATGIVAIGASGVVSLTPIPIFRADHPFIFLIQERETGNILFMGKVTNPKG